MLYNLVVTVRTKKFDAQKFNVLYLCVLYVPQTKQRLFPYKALNDGFLQLRGSVYCAVRTDYIPI